MKRKDILIITAILIIIAFLTTFTMYYILNDGEIFSSKGENTQGKVEKVKTHHSNGWETAIVEKIVDKVPIPVGFTYVEGKQKKGLIIEDNETKERYMWIPYTEDVNEELYQSIMSSCNLGNSAEADKESIEKYNGFYILVDGIIEGDVNTITTLTEEEKQEKILQNTSYGKTFSTHLTTAEEMTAILAYNEKIDNKIQVTNYKTLTVLGESANQEIKVKVNGEEIQFGSLKPEVKDGILYVPLKQITELIGGKVCYREGDKTLHIAKDNQTIVLSEENKFMHKREINIVDREIKYLNSGEKINLYEGKNIYPEFIKISEKKGPENTTIPVYDCLIPLQTYIQALNGTVEMGDKIVNINIEKKEASTLARKYENAVGYHGMNIETVIDVQEEQSDANVQQENTGNQGNTNEQIINTIEDLIDVSKGVPIPAGFEYVEGTVETGFKIKDTDNLAFVWIPVELTEEEKTRDLSEVIREKIKVKAAEEGMQDIDANIPDTYKDDKTNDEQYNKLSESIKKYGGFYISEAELGYDENGHNINTYRDMYNTVGSENEQYYNYVSNGDYYRNVGEANVQQNKGKMTELQTSFKLKYESAIDTCEKLYELSESVESHLTYGLEYDATLLYLLEKCPELQTKAIITNNDGTTENKSKVFEYSVKIGKYKNSDHSSYIKRETATKLNGIYGLAGNLAEITREKNTETGEIIVRGGHWDSSNEQEFMAIRESMSNQSIEEDTGKIGIRACLYIKTEYESNVNLENTRNSILNIIDGNGNAENIDNDRYNTIIELARGISEVVNTDVNKNKTIYKTIVEEIKEKISEVTSLTAIEQILKDAKFAIDQITYHINQINNYKTEVTGNEAKNIRNDAINKIENLSYNLATKQFINSNGEVERLQSILDKVKADIDVLAQNNGQTQNNDQQQSDEITVGSYVKNYRPKANGQYEVKAEKSGWVNSVWPQVDVLLNWRVLNINNDGTVDLISDRPSRDSYRIYLSGQTGYNNSSEILNDICNKLYSNSEIGAVARSINIDDILSKISENYNIEANHKNTGKTPYNTEKDGYKSTYLNLNSIEFKEQIYKELFFGEDGYFFYPLDSKFTYIDEPTKRIEYGLQVIGNNILDGEVLYTTNMDGTKLGSKKIYVPVRPIVTVPLEALTEKNKTSNTNKFKTGYEGEYKDGKANGYGTYTWANGDVYEGEWKDDKKNGQGKITYANGDVYEGEWKDDLGNGQGKYTWASGAVYEGEFKDGLSNGQGKMTYASGDVYEGEWKDDKRNGQGKYTRYNDDGSIWSVEEGEFKEGKLNGQGKITYYNKDGSIDRVEEGQFENGEVKKGTLDYLKSGR